MQPLSNETRRKLIEAIGANLPPELKEDQALWWIRPEHSVYLTGALENLAKVAVLLKDPK